MSIALSPSRAARRLACPGSYWLEAKFQSKDSDSTREGIAAHWVATEYLRQASSSGESLDLVDKFTPEGELITQEMVDGAKLFTTEVMQIIANNTTEACAIGIEQNIDIGIIHPLCKGRCDCFVIHSETLSVFDYKYGHKPVEAFENWQLIEYAAGLVDKYYDIKHINLFVIQPRNFVSNPVKLHTFDYDQLWEYIEKLRVSEANAVIPQSPVRPSEQCFTCNARHACAGLKSAALAGIELSESSLPDNVSPQEMGAELRILNHAKKLMEARQLALQEQILDAICKGESIPGFKAEWGTGKTVWELSDGEVIEMAKLFGMDLAKPIEAITPKQAEKKGFDKDLIKQFTKQQSGGIKLVEDDLQLTRKIFNQ